MRGGGAGVVRGSAGRAAGPAAQPPRWAKPAESRPCGAAWPAARMPAACRGLRRGRACGGTGGKGYAEKCRSLRGAGWAAQPARGARLPSPPPAGGRRPSRRLGRLRRPMPPVAAQTGKSVNAPRPMFCPPWHPPAAGRPAARRTPSPAAPAPAPLRRSPAGSR